MSIGTATIIQFGSILGGSIVKAFQKLAIVFAILISGVFATDGTAVAQIVPGGSGTFDENTDFMSFYVESTGFCGAMCFTSSGSSTISVATGFTKDPLGNTTNSWVRPILWDEDNNGEDEPLDMDKYVIEAVVLSATPSPDGKLHLVILVKATNTETNETINIESFPRTVKQSDVVGGGGN